MPRFDSTITLGNLLTVATLVTAIVFGWVKMEARLVVLENVAQQNRIELNQQALISQKIQDNTTRLTTMMDVYVLPQLARLQGEIDRK